MSSNYKNLELIDKNIIKCELTFKIIIIGDSFVGKSCLSLKAVNGTFNKLYSPTVGFEYFNYSVNLDNYKINLQIWDTCGQEAYRSLINSFYHSSSLAILVYSIDSEQSFNNLEMWINEVKNKGNPDISFILIGNKADLEDNRQVTKEMANELCEDNNIQIFLETSAKSGLNVKNMFYEAANILLEKHKKHRNRISSTESMKNFQLENNLSNQDTANDINNDNINNSNNNNINNNININENDEGKEHRVKRCCF